MELTDKLYLRNPTPGHVIGMQKLYTYRHRTTDEVQKGHATKH